MSDEVLRCFNCRKALDVRKDHADAELNRSGGGQVGFHHGKLCGECEREFANMMERTTGGNI